MRYGARIVPIYPSLPVRRIRMAPRSPGRRGAPDTSWLRHRSDRDLGHLGRAWQPDRSDDHSGDVLGLEQALRVIWLALPGMDRGLTRGRGPARKHGGHSNALRVHFVPEGGGKGTK